MRSMASFFDFGSERSFQTGLRVLTKSRKWSASIVLLEELARRRIPVDIDLVYVHACVVQKTSGVFARRSGRLGVKGGLHRNHDIFNVRESAIQSEICPLESELSRDV